MKKSMLFPFIMIITVLVLFISCSTSVTVTSWKNPQEKAQIGNIVVWGMFEKLEYQKPFEEYAAAYFNSKGLKSMSSLQFLAPGKKYDLDVLEKKFDSLGVDGILVVTYKGTDKSESYVPPTTTAYPDYYYNYYNYYNWGYPVYGYGANVVTTGGYWVTSSVINLKANLYSNATNGLIWSADIAVDDPEYIDQATHSVAKQVYADWVKSGLLKQ